MTIRYFIHDMFSVVRYLIVFLCPIFTWAQNDSIWINNGDRVIGEIVKMDKGVLTVDADYGDSNFKINWEDIKLLNTDRSFLILFSNGNRIHFDSIRYEKNEKSFILKNAHNHIIGDSIEIVYFRPVEDKIMSRLEATISAGYNYTKSTSLKQLSIAATTAYNSKFWSGESEFSYVLNSQHQVEDTYRLDSDTKFSYHLDRNYFLFYGLKFLSVSEMNLNLRFTNKIGLGRYFIRNNSMYFAGGLGLVWNNESYDLDSKFSRNSGEFLANFELNYFNIDNLTLLARANIYPSFTESSRFRMDLNFDAKYDLPLDFFIKFSYKYNYDSKPLENTLKDDYILQTTIGWEF